MPTANTIKNILVVDDEKLFANTITRHLRMEGFTVETAYDGSEGQSKVEKNATSDKAFELVITDINMPNLNGIGLIKWLHESHPAISIIIVSGLGVLEVISTILRPGLDLQAEKPLTPQKMMELIAAMNISRRQNVMIMT